MSVFVNPVRFSKGYIPECGPSGKEDPTPLEKGDLKNLFLSNLRVLIDNRSFWICQ